MGGARTEGEGVGVNTNRTHDVEQHQHDLIISIRNYTSHVNSPDQVGETPAGGRGGRGGGGGVYIVDKLDIEVYSVVSHLQ